MTVFIKLDNFFEQKECIYYKKLLINLNLQKAKTRS